VITPEGCAAILWREATPDNVAAAASALRLSAPDLLRMGIADEIIAEPPGGAHRNPAAAAAALGKALGRHLARLVKLDAEELRAARDRKFAAMGSAFVLDTSSNGQRSAPGNAGARVEKRGGIG